MLDDMQPVVGNECRRSRKGARRTEDAQAASGGERTGVARVTAQTTQSSNTPSPQSARSLSPCARQCRNVAKAGLDVARPMRNRARREASTASKRRACVGWRERESGRAPCGEA